jgi:hypothetical protein
MSDETKIEQEVKALAPIVDQARGLVIRDQLGRDNAMTFLRDVKSAQKRIGDLCDPVVKQARAAWDAAKSQRDGLLAPFADAERAVKALVIAWDNEQSRIAEMERRRLQAEADAKAEAERKRALAAAAKLKTPELQAERIAQAEEIMAPVVQVVAPVVKSEGEQVRVLWKAECTDKAALIAAAAGGDQAAASMLVFDQVAANGFARGTKGAVQVPGVRIYSERSMAVRG